MRAKDYRRINNGKKPRFCRYCSVLLTKRGPTKATKDHVVPKSKGGSNARWNIVMGVLRLQSGESRDDPVQRERPTATEIPMSRTALNWNDHE